MSHSFIQNCCINEVSQHQGWTVGHYQFTDLAYADDATILISWSAPSRQCPPINAFAALLGLSYRGPSKLQNLGAGDPPSKILIDGVPVEGVEELEEFIYLGSKQKWLLPTDRCSILVRRIGLACFSIFSLIFSFYFGSCGRLSWLNSQLSSAR